MKNVTLKNKVAKGFSLVEMLVVIAVIGVIAAIAIPNIGSINSSAKEAKNQRNAQSIVSVYAAATAAGVTTIATGTKEARVALLTSAAGVKPVGGAFDGKVFKVPNVAAGEDLDGALKYMSIDEATGDLVYSKTPITP